MRGCDRCKHRDEVPSDSISARSSVLQDTEWGRAFFLLTRRVVPKCFRQAKAPRRSLSCKFSPQCCWIHLRSSSQKQCICTTAARIYCAIHHAFPIETFAENIFYLNFMGENCQIKVLWAGNLNHGGEGLNSSTLSAFRFTESTTFLRRATIFNKSLRLFFQSNRLNIIRLQIFQGGSSAKHQVAYAQFQCGSTSDHRHCCLINCVNAFLYL